MSFTKDGTYDYYVGNDVYSYGGSVTINKGGKTINLKVSDGELGLSSTSDIKVTTPTAGVKPTITNGPFIEEVSPKIATVESGILGDNIHYIIYADGFMLVYGSGEMYDGGYNYEHADIVTDVSVENIDNNEYITNIGAYSFAGLKNMTKIELPETVTSIGEGAFEQCSSIKTLTIPSKVTSIGNSAFSGCRNLTGISIPSTVKTIGDYAFNECKAFTTVTVPGTVETIGSFAFANCTGLKNAVIEDGVGYINSWIFDNCSSLESLTLPYAGHSLTDVAENNSDWLAAFLNHDETSGTYMAGWWYAYKVLKTVTITGGSTIPSSFFEGMQGLTTITLPNTIVTIHGYAFNGCSGLTSITIPNSVTTIGESAFGSCTKLTGISIPSSVTSLGANVFNECKSFTNVTIPGTVKNIGSGLFSNCTSLKEVTISDGVENIEDHIFENCTSLQKITLPYAGHSASRVASNEESSLATSYFSYGVTDDTYDVNSYGVPYSLKSVIITGGVSVPSYAFANMNSLTEIKLPNTVTVIYNNAFDSCTGLSKIDFIPSSVKSIGDEAFVRCSNAITASVPNGTLTIGTRTFAECTSLVNVTLPATLTTIGERAFESCSSLRGLFIPNGVTAIGVAAFNECTSIEKITIPGNVKSIGDNMLINCTGLKEVTIENGVSNIGNWIFDGCVSLEKITLPYAGQSEASVAANTENPIARSLFWYGLSEDAYSVNGWGVPYTLKSIVITGGACIPSYAFYGLSSVNEITIYGGATVIHNNAFEGCSGLTSISIPEGVEFLESGAFANCTSLSEIKFYNPNITIDTYSETLPRVATIYGWNNSTAQRYAEDYNRKFVSLGDYLTAPTLIGDCNLDGVVNVEDARTLQDYLLAIYSFNREAWLNADINQDGSADVFDLCLLKRMLING